ncbi:SHOCT domain-containing protein [Halopiger aswanensis]|uniref:Putative oligomerization/nucleic acid binding protein n=1 Tax=Halopiger aswanensis TaxID=148449 RepID=A0A3R7DAI1_9EURY|nr:SHOCT domain-containing protein [Halopiger aswanensis]RKD88097.1 putative oligomerization/nucleic acid binding protein [Halopiger aswanensis]
MYDLLHRYAPRSPAGRTVVAIVAASIAVPTTIQGVWELTRDVPAAPPYLLLGAVLFAIAGCLTVGVVREANAAPDSASPADRRSVARAADADTVPGGRGGRGNHGNRPADPIETLRQRYAAGELGDDEFERRLERLVETEGTRGIGSETESTGRPGAEPDRVLEGPTTSPNSSRDVDTERA